MSDNGAAGIRGPMRRFPGSAPRASRARVVRSAPRVDALEPRRLLAVMPLGDVFTVSGLEGGLEPNLAHGGSGRYVVAWTGSDGSAQGVLAQPFDAAGDPVGANIHVNTFTTDHQFGPSVAMDFAGDFVVVWRSVGQN